MFGKTVLRRTFHEEAPAAARTASQHIAADAEMTRCLCCRQNTFRVVSPHLAIAHSSCWCFLWGINMMGSSHLTPFVTYLMQMMNGN